MNKEEIYNKVQDIFRDIFDDTDLVINESTNAQDIEEWDSFNQIVLVSAIEKEFLIKFDVSELSSLKDVGAMIDKMIEKIN